jgi:hypothetical protein
MKYMLIIVGPEGDEQDQRSPEEIREAMGAWSDYSNALSEAGAFIAGEGLQPSATATTVKRTEDDERIVSDGPFAETKEQVGGFYLIECANLDEALEWTKKIPVSPGNSVEVRPVMDFSEHGYEDPSEAKATAS